MRRDGPERTRRTGRTRTPLLAASAGERGAGPLANYARRAGPLHSAVHPFLRLQLGPGPLGRGLHQHLGRRGGHGPRRPHRRGPDGDLLGSAGSDGALYRERNRTWTMRRRSAMTQGRSGGRLMRRLFPPPALRKAFLASSTRTASSAGLTLGSTDINANKAGHQIELKGHTPRSITLTVTDSEGRTKTYTVNLTPEDLVAPGGGWP